MSEMNEAIQVPQINLPRLNMNSRGIRGRQASYLEDGEKNVNQENRVRPVTTKASWRPQQSNRRSQSHLWKPKGTQQQLLFPQTTRALASGPTPSWPLSAIAAPEFQPTIDLHNPFEKECPASFRMAMDSILGLPLGGSLVFVRSADFSETVWRCVGQGPAKFSCDISDKLSISLESGGFHDGDYSKILINNVDFSPNQKGINVLVLHPASLDAYVGVFDTHSQVGNESSHLSRFLREISEEQVVMISIRYDASRRLQPQARQALLGIGVKIPESDDVAKIQRCIDVLDAEKSSELLSMCAAVNAPRCAKILIEHGWNINYQKQRGSRNTPLLDATFHASIDVLRILIHHGAKRDLRNKWNETAQDLATKLFGFKSLDAMVAPRNCESVEKVYDVEKMESE